MSREAINGALNLLLKATWLYSRLKMQIHGRLPILVFTAMVAEAKSSDLPTTTVTLII